MILPQVLQAAEGAPTNTTAFVSKKTGVVVQNSLAYLDHIHAKKYQRAMGMSMRVKAADLSDVQARLQRLKAEKAPAKRKKGSHAADAMRPDLQGKLQAFNEKVSTQLAARKRAREEVEPPAATQDGTQSHAAGPEPQAHGHDAAKKTPAKIPRAGQPQPEATEAAAPASSSGGQESSRSGTDAAAGRSADGAADDDDELAAMQAMMGFAGFASGNNS